MTSVTPYGALEAAWKALLSPSITGIAAANIYLTDTNVIALHPCLKITTPDFGEDPAMPGYGVFKGISVLSYETKAAADQITPASAGAAFESIIQALYWLPANVTVAQNLPQFLGSRLTTAYGGAFTCFNAVPVRNAINKTNPMEKTWIKELRIPVWWMNRANS